MKVNKLNGISRATISLVGLYAIYLILLALSINRHELWGDELHSFNIAKASSTFGDLNYNSRYEGHPPLWYTLLFIVTRFSHEPVYMQYLHFFISALLAFVLVFRLKFSLLQNVLILFSYFFFYEYGVLSRNYALGLFFALLICSEFQKGEQLKAWKYYLFLFLLTQTHVLGFMLAASFQVYFLMCLKSENPGMKLKHLLFSALMLMPALYFIFPPSNSALGTDFWLSIWTKDRLFMSMQAPIKAFMPIPAFWEDHFWNTEFLIAMQSRFGLLKFILPVLSLFLLFIVVYILRADKKALLFFVVNLVLTLTFSLIFPLSSSRYVGFLFVAFIVAFSLSGQSQLLTKKQSSAFYTLLVLQFCGTMIGVSKDWSLPFSESNHVKSLYTQVPDKSTLITDYWCLNDAVAFLDEPVYCVGFNTQKSFLLWDKALKQLMQEDSLYTKGTAAAMLLNHKTVLYLMTNKNAEELNESDVHFLLSYQVDLIRNYSEAIEKHSNLYLYRISLKQ